MRALEIAPDHFGALCNLANALLSQGDEAGALEKYAKAMNAKPGDPTVINNYGRALSALGRLEEAIEFADQSMEAVSYYAIQASTRLAEERGTYSSYQGSLWSQGILPIDSIAKLKAARGDYLQQDESSRMNWDSLRQRVMSIGMRNSNTMAIAPTATISNICGVSQSIEPIYQNLFVTKHPSG